MSRSSRTLCIWIAILSVTAVTLWTARARAFERYNDGCNNAACHGAFTDATTPKGSVFPGNSKHTMHRSNQAMNTECDLCHSAGDGNNPFTGSSDGTNDNPGLGCTGCHDKWGLRAHHPFQVIDCS
ncbi:MAG: hypothetical protein OEM67_12480, partial [Thermoleophilia bacterium]|nr:hypothetical protein [Thermoleophilia bacterium]